jgi:hypothetical protein
MRIPIVPWWTVFWLALPAALPAQIPLGTSFTYQGRLSDGGSPAGGSYDFQFVLYDAAVSGAQVGPIVVREDVAVAEGLFAVALDFGAVFAGSRRWLDIGVRPGASTGAFTPVGPRQELTPAPAALFSVAAPWTGVSGKPAGFADNVDNDSGGTVTSVTAGAGLTGGTITSSGTLAVSFGGSGGAATAARSDHDHLGAFWSGSASPGLEIATSGSTALSAQSSAAGGTAVLGSASATSGETVGVWGQTFAPSGIGVLGSATAVTGLAFGVQGTSTSPQGRGVSGLNFATTGAAPGVFGFTTSISGAGVHGRANPASGQAYGVRGESFSPDGVGVGGSGPWGVYGTSTTGIGVYGEASDAVAVNYGLYGVTSSTSGYAVAGIAAASSGTNYGVWGRTNSAAGYAGFFLGRVAVTGTLSKGGGSFKIDHPLDPENKYLYHSFVESPDMKNIYDGVATTDEAGFAVVELPEWFEALNRDFRYQLTVIGGGAWARARVSREIAASRFVIQTDVAGTKVSWQVTGIRKDPFAEKHRIPVEEDKPEDERGTYLHAEAWGEPKERGLEAKRWPGGRP